ncbi:MAG: hypothetical protein IJ055_07380 [Oscillospiraceae bacterium]|nr:hypothetical protein [Oscillospiraceae bacterium]
MTGKKSFVIYYDNAAQFDMLDDTQLGALFRAMYRYAALHEQPAFTDPTLQLAFSFLRGQLDRDAEKYEDICRKRSEAGKKGGRPKANASPAFPEKAEKADTICESDSETIRDTVSDTVCESAAGHGTVCDTGAVRGDPQPDAAAILRIARGLGYTWTEWEALRFLAFNRDKGRTTGWEYAVRRWEENRTRFPTQEKLRSDAEMQQYLSVVNRFAEEPSL